MKKDTKMVKIKNSNMPTGIEELDTSVLLDILDGTNTETDWTVEECAAELKYRVVPQDDPVTETRGFIRPRRPHL